MLSIYVCIYIHVVWMYTCKWMCRQTLSNHVNLKYLYKATTVSQHSCISIISDCKCPMLLNLNSLIMISKYIMAESKTKNVFERYRRLKVEGYIT